MWKLCSYGFSGELMRTTKDIIDLIKLAKSLQIYYLKIGSLEVHFENAIQPDQRLPYTPLPFTSYSQPILPNSQDTTELDLSAVVKPLSVLDQFTEEEILYYGTPYFDELQAKKQEHQEKLNKELKERVNG